MKDEDTKKFTVIVLLIIASTLAFLVIKSIFLSILGGIILGYVFNPIYKFFLRLSRSKNLSAFLVCLFTLLIIIIPLWFLAPLAIKQTFEVYRVAQQIDFLAPLKQTFPNIFTSNDFNQAISTSITSLITRTANSVLESLSTVLLNLPVIFLHLTIIFFTFFYVMRDQEDIFDYLISLSPFDRETEKKFENYSKAITSSVIYGHFVVGVINGLIVGLGLFIFKVPNFLFLTLIAVILGVLPVIGTPLIWIPAVFYLLFSGNTSSAIGMTIIGVFASSLENILRPIFVARRTKVHSVIVLTGMLGGFLFIGILGLIIGPLILAYVIILLEIFKKKDQRTTLIEIKN